MMAMYNLKLCWSVNSEAEIYDIKKRDVEDV